MSTATNGDFNTSPYYDDYASSKNFMQILFEPGRAVQARELSQIQSLLQNQIGSMGDHLFAEGTVVIGGDLRFDNEVPYIWLENNTDLTGWNGEAITGAVSGAKAKILSLHSDTSTKPIAYLQVFSGAFTAGEAITRDSDAATRNIDSSSNANAVGKLAAFVNIGNGVYYINNFFVPVTASSIVVGDDNASPTDEVGFTLVKEIITSGDDTSLLDPASGFPNFNAPGADRYKLNPVLTTKSYHDANNASLDFLSLMTINNGVVEKTVLRTDNALLEETFARRTFDESGNYHVRHFPIGIQETNPTIAGNDDDTKFTIKVEAGKAYVRGIEIEKIAPSYLEVDKARVGELYDNYSAYLEYGPYVVLDDAQVTKDWAFNIHKWEEVQLQQSDGTIVSTTNAISMDVQGTETRLYLKPWSTMAADMPSVAKVVGQLTASSADIKVFTVSTTNPTGKIHNTNKAINPLILRTPTDYVSRLISGNISVESAKNYSITGGVYDAGTGETTYTLTDLAGTFSSQSIIQAARMDTSVVVNTTYTSGAGSTAIVFTITGDLSGVTVEVIARPQITMDVRSKTNTTIASETITGASTKFTMAHTDIIEITSIDGVAWASVTDYTFDNGQRDYTYEQGILTHTAGGTPPSTIDVAYKYYAHGSGDVFAVNSYITDHTVPSGMLFEETPSDNTEYEAIGSYTSETGGSIFNLRDSLDFRPDYNQVNTSFIEIPHVQDDITFDFFHYLPRIDILYLESTGNFVIGKGIPDINPQVPSVPETAMPLYNFLIPAYTFNLSDIGTQFVDNKRYTMNDIQDLEGRIENVEYYTALSILEQSAINMDIKDEYGLDRFKNGIVVDNFRGHGVGDVNHPDYLVAVDPASSALRLPFTIGTHEHSLDNASSTGNSITGVGITNEILDDDVILLDQSKASETENVVRFLTFLWNGSITLSPETDQWVDTSRNANLVVDMGSNRGAWEAAFPGSFNGWNTEWNSWQTNNIGVSTSISQFSRVIGRNGEAGISTSTTTTMDQSRVGIQRSFAENTRTESLGDRVIDVSLVPWMRARAIIFEATQLRPNTLMIPYFDGVDISSNVVWSGNNVTDSSGSISGTFNIPAGTYSVGVKEFELKDRDEQPTTAAISKYTANGIATTHEETVASITTITGSRQEINEERHLSSSVSSEIITRRWTFDDSDPLAQTFLIQGMEGGVYVTALELWFHRLAVDLPVAVEIREVINGFPGPAIIPFSQKNMTPAEILTQGGWADNDAFLASNDDYNNIATKFTFDSPVYLMNNTEYCFIIKTDTTEYEVWVAKLGGFEKTSSGDGARISQQPTLGSMFMSQNNRTWTPDQTRDVAFRLMRASFNTGDASVAFSADPASQEAAHILMLSAEEMLLEGTEIDWYAKFPSQSDYVAVTNRTNKELDSAYNFGAGQPVEWKAIMKTSSENTSAIVNKDRLGFQNIVNSGLTQYVCKQIGTGEIYDGITTESDCTLLADVDNSTEWVEEGTGAYYGNYLTKTIELDDPASELSVFMSELNTTGRDIDVYFSLGNNVFRHCRVDITTNAYNLTDIIGYWKGKYVYTYDSTYTTVSAIPAGNTPQGSPSAARAYCQGKIIPGPARDRMYLGNVDDTTVYGTGSWICEYDLDDSTVWDTALDYIAGDIVKYSVDGEFYIALAAVSGGSTNDPTQHLDLWLKIPFIKITSSGLTTTEFAWIPMQRKTSTKFTRKRVENVGWMEWEYEPTYKIMSEFTSFTIRIVLSSTDETKTPYIRDFRAIATA